MNLEAQQFYINVDVQADYASYYNHFTLGNLFGGKICLRLYNVDNTVGTVNQNIFSGGRCGSSGSTGEMVGVLFHNGGTEGGFNGGTGISQNFIGITYLWPSPGAANLLSPAAVTDLVTLQQNTIVGDGEVWPYTNVLSQIGGVSRSNLVTAATGHLQRSGQTVLLSTSSSPPYYYNGASTTSLGLSASSITSASSSYQIGVMVDASAPQRDWLRYLILDLTAAGTGGRVYIFAQDAAGNQLTSSGDIGGLFYSSGSKAWLSGSDIPSGNSKLFVSLGPNVKYLFVGIGAGSSALNTVGMKIYSNTDSGIVRLTDWTTLSTLNGGTALGLFPDDNAYTVSIPDSGSGYSYPQGFCARNISIVSGGTVPSAWCANGSGTFVPLANVP